MLIGLRQIWKWRAAADIVFRWHLPVHGPVLRNSRVLIRRPFNLSCALSLPYLRWRLSRSPIQPHLMHSRHNSACEQRVWALSGLLSAPTHIQTWIVVSKTRRSLVPSYRNPVGAKTWGVESMLEQDLRTEEATIRQTALAAFISRSRFNANLLNWSKAPLGLLREDRQRHWWRQTDRRPNVLTALCIAFLSFRLISYQGWDDDVQIRALEWNKQRQTQVLASSGTLSNCTNIHLSTQSTLSTTNLPFYPCLITHINWPIDAGISLGHFVES